MIWVDVCVCVCVCVEIYFKYLTAYWLHFQIRAEQNRKGEINYT